MGSYILALDVGTGALHALLAGPRGVPIASASAPMHYHVPPGCPSLAREFSPEEVMNGLFDLITGLLKSSGIRPGDIGSIGVTSQRQGVVFLDHVGREIYAGPNVDLRATFEGAAMDEELGETLYRTTGHFPSMMMVPARLRWFRNHRASLYSQTRTVLTIACWVDYRLTGVPLADPALDGEAGLLDIRRKTRCLDLIGGLGVLPSMLPPLPPEGNGWAELSPAVARSLGLEEGIPVVVAGPDTQCGLLGMGLTREGDLGAVMGWSGALQVITSGPCFDEEMRTWVGCYQDGSWVAEANLGDAGNAYRWLKDTLLGPDVSFETAEQLAQQSPAEPDGLVAFLGPGPVSAQKAGLRLGGLLFPTPLSFQETNRGQLLRAALENIAYSVRANVGILRAVTGLDPQLLHVGGGMARSRTLAETLAGVLGIPVRRHLIPEVSARGAALVAAARAQPEMNLSQVVELACDSYEEIEPGDPSQLAQHQERYERWLQLYRRLEWD